jgi:hypothetical protein
MNIELDHGCGYSVWRQYLESDGVTPIDCTGASLSAQVRPEPGGTLLGAFAFTWIDRTQGTFFQTMSTAAVNAIPDGVHAWDLIFTDSTGATHKIDEGSCTKRGTITQL